MLRQNDLDDELFSEIAERARLRAAEYLPVWNDFNSHDPGIMLIELLSWLTEAQRFHMDQSEQAAAFFPLLGITPHRVSPAEAELYLPQGAPKAIPAGTPIMAEDIRFELEEPVLRSLSAKAPRKAVQRHTLCEDIDCGANLSHIEPGTYLSVTGESMLFRESGGVYTRIAPMEKTNAPETGFACFAPQAGAMPPGSFHIVSCEHRALRLRVPGTANGFPKQRFVVDTHGQRILHNGFVLLIGEDREMSRARKWTLVEDFRASGPSDTHYTLDDETGLIAFGDGIHGLMPKGIVFIAAMALTHGAGGNIMAERLTELVYGDCRWALAQPYPAKNGADHESTAEVMARLKAERRQAVTAKDIETLVTETPGVEIECARAFTNETAPAPGHPRLITIAAKPFGARASLSAEQRRAIRAFLEPYRLAGYDYRIVPPKYAGIRLRITLSTQRHDTAFKHMLETAVRDFFRTSFGGFGVKIRRGDIAGFLSGIAGVSQVHACETETYGNDARADERGDIDPAQDTLAYLEELHLRIISPAG